MYSPTKLHRSFRLDKPIRKYMYFDPRDVVAIPLERFISGLKTDVDVFIKLAEDNYILLTKGGDSFELDQLHRYKEYNLKCLFVRNSDLPAFLKQQVSVAGIILKNDKIEVYRKSAILSNVMHSVFDDLDRVGLNTQNLDSAREISINVINLIESHPDLLKILVGLNDVENEFVRHSIAVGFTSILVAKELKWNRKDTLEKLALGGILHDIGKKEIPQEILKKPRIEMTSTEIREYESHPYRGMMILQAIPSMPEDVVKIVYEHHENAIGQGFPRKLWDTKIHPLARVVGVANTFCNLIMASTNNPDPKFVDHAVYHMRNIMGKPYSKEIFQALQNIVITKDKKVA